MDNNTINARIATVISHLRLSQTAFAKSLGTSATRISNIIQGRNKPDTQLLEHIATTYPQINTTWLLTGNEGLEPNVKFPGLLISENFTSAGSKNTPLTHPYSTPLSTPPDWTSPIATGNNTANEGYNEDEFPPHDDEPVTPQEVAAARLNYWGEPEAYLGPQQLYYATLNRYEIDYQIEEQLEALMEALVFYNTIAGQFNYAFRNLRSQKPHALETARKVLKAIDNEAQETNAPNISQRLQRILFLIDLETKTDSFLAGARFIANKLPGSAFHKEEAISAVYGKAYDSREKPKASTLYEQLQAEGQPATTNQPLGDIESSTPAQDTPTTDKSA